MFVVMVTNHREMEIAMPSRRRIKSHDVCGVFFEFSLINFLSLSRPFLLFPLLQHRLTISDVFSQLTDCVMENKTARKDYSCVFNSRLYLLKPNRLFFRIKTENKKNVFFMILMVGKFLTGKRNCQAHSLTPFAHPTYIHSSL